MAYHFADVSKMVSVGSGAEREIDDIYFTRYACYLTAKNGDARKPAIAFAQNYYDGKPRNLSGTIACRRRFKAVSYTHLDVYKIQECGRLYFRW